jgi:hypothetical protein
MTVNELIDKLKELPQDSVIHMDDTDIQNEDAYLDIEMIKQIGEDWVIKPKY